MIVNIIQHNAYFFFLKDIQKNIQKKQYVAEDESFDSPRGCDRGPLWTGEGKSDRETWGRAVGGNTDLVTGRLRAGGNVDMINNPDQKVI